MNAVLLCAAAAVAPASPPLGAPRSMWRAVEAACSRGECARHSNTTTAIKNTTDCYGRLLTYDYALTAIPALAPMREAFDSLELKGCGIHPPSQSTPRRVSASNAAGGATVYVDATRGSDVNAGTEAKPVQTIAHALLLARAAAGPPAATIILRAGTHFLAETVDLTPTDSGLTIKAYTGEDAAISGGVPLRDLTWSRASSLGNDGAATSPNVWKATLSKAVKPFISLGTLSPHRRVTRARYPNADPEIQSIWNPAEAIKIWQHDLSCAGKAQVVYKDLREGCGMSERDALDAGTRPCKNDSAMWDTYNTFANGHGGCCATWAGDGSPYGPMGDYFCGNSSAGGWVGFADIRGKNRTQGLSPMLPTGFIYNATLAPWLAKVADLEGALVHVWRDQGWFVTMYRVAEHDVQGSTVTFGRRPDGVVDGGWQGGRGMQIDAAALKDPTQSVSAQSSLISHPPLSLYLTASRGSSPSHKSYYYVVSHSRWLVHRERQGTFGRAERILSRNCDQHLVLLAQRNEHRGGCSEQPALEGRHAGGNAAENIDRDERHDVSTDQRHYPRRHHLPRRRGYRDGAVGSPQWRRLGASPRRCDLHRGVRELRRDALHVHADRRQRRDVERIHARRDGGRLDV